MKGVTQICWKPFRLWINVTEFPNISIDVEKRIVRIATGWWGHNIAFGWSRNGPFLTHCTYYQTKRDYWTEWMEENEVNALLRETKAMKISHKPEMWQQHTGEKIMVDRWGRWANYRVRVEHGIEPPLAFKFK